MKKSILFVISFIICWSTTVFAQSEKEHFWQTHRKGLFINHMLLPSNQTATLNILASAKVDFFYLVPTLVPETRGVDFLTRGKTGALNEEDMTQLRAFLDGADTRGVKVILGFCSQPWDTNETLWSRKEAIRFWQEIAKRLANQAACIGYDIVSLPVDISSTYELNDYYSEVVRIIRAVDPSTTIVLESFHGDSNQLWHLQPVKSDPNVLYAVAFSVPVVTKAAGYEIDTQRLVLRTLNIAQWASHNGVNPRQVWVYGFPCIVPPSVEGYNYLGLIEGFKLYGWHHASLLPPSQKSAPQKPQGNGKKYNI